MEVRALGATVVVVAVWWWLGAHNIFDVWVTCTCAHQGHRRSVCVCVCVFCSCLVLMLLCSGNTTRSVWFGVVWFAVCARRSV